MVCMLPTFKSFHKFREMFCPTLCMLNYYYMYICTCYLRVEMCIMNVLLTAEFSHFTF